MFCQLAVGKMGYPGAEAVRFLGVTTSSVNRLLAIEEMPDLRKYLKCFGTYVPVATSRFSHGPVVHAAAESKNNQGNDEQSNFHRHLLRYPNTTH